MQMSSAYLVLAIVAVAGLLVAPSVFAAQGERKLVEVWHVGDDIYTAGLADALERAFQSSPDFVLSNGNKQGTLVVTIPTNLTWKRRFGRTTVSYVVDFTTSDGQKLGSVNGACPSKQFAKCAARIVEDARHEASKTHQQSTK